MRGNPFGSCFIPADILGIYFQFFGKFFLRPAGRGSFFTQTAPKEDIDVIAVFVHGSRFQPYFATPTAAASRDWLARLRIGR